MTNIEEARKNIQRFFRKDAQCKKPKDHQGGKGWRWLGG